MTAARVGFWVELHVEVPRCDPVIGLPVARLRITCCRPVKQIGAAALGGGVCCESAAAD